MEMNKWAVCGLMCFAGVAQAQSSVTLYGIVDEFIQYQNVGRGYTAAVQSSGQWASRIGFRGREDLGGGDAINFTLEEGFVPNTGGFSDPTSMFSRQAWVGASGHWGEVRLGRQNSPLFITWGRVDAFAGVTQASGIDNFSTYTLRTSNTASYISPVLAGFQASIYAGLGTAGGFRHPGSNYQYSVTYDNGPLAAHYAGQGVWSATNNALDRSTAGAVSYKLGSVTGYLGYHAVDWPDIVAKYRVYSVSARYAFTPSSNVGLGGAYLRDRTAKDNDAAQISALYNYYLSKATTIYVAVSFLKNRNNAVRTLVGAANGGVAVAYPGADARGIQIGLVQRF